MRELSVREIRGGHGAITAALEAEGEPIVAHHAKPFAGRVALSAGVDVPDPAAEQRKRARMWAPGQRRFLAGQPELPPFVRDAFRADR